MVPRRLLEPRSGGGTARPASALLSPLDTRELRPRLAARRRLTRRVSPDESALARMRRRARLLQPLALGGLALTGAYRRLDLRAASHQGRVRGVDRRSARSAAHARRVAGDE